MRIAPALRDEPCELAGSSTRPDSTSTARPPRAIYTQKLIDSGVEGAKELAAEMERSFTAMLDERLNEAKQVRVGRITNFMAERWKGFRRATVADLLSAPATGVKKETLRMIGELFISCTKKIHQS